MDLKYKNKKLTILSILVIFSVYFVYYFIGYLVNTDILNAITPHRNGFSISFYGIFLLFGTSLLVVYFIGKYREKRKK